MPIAEFWAVPELSSKCSCGLQVTLLQAKIQLGRVLVETDEGRDVGRLWSAVLHWPQTSFVRDQARVQAPPSSFVESSSWRPG